MDFPKASFPVAFLHNTGSTFFWMHEWTDLKINLQCVYSLLCLSDSLSNNTNREIELSNVAELNFPKTNSNFGTMT